MIGERTSEQDLLRSFKEAVEGLHSLEMILRDVNPCRYCNFNPRSPEEDVPYFKAEFYKGLNDTIAKLEKQLEAVGL